MIYQCDRCDWQKEDNPGCTECIHCGGHLSVFSSQVSNPPHYNTGDLECIDAIVGMLGDDGAVAYCRGNALKYLWRCLYKNSYTTDLDKAVWYINKAKELHEST